MKDEEETIATDYTEIKVQEMVAKKFKNMRKDGQLATIQDIYASQPASRLNKDNYNFTFDVMKNNIEDKMLNQGKLQKLLEREHEALMNIEIKHHKNVEFKNTDELYSQKLQSGLPIFKSIIYMRYQSNDRWEELLGEEKAFLPDQHKLHVNQLKTNVQKIKLFLEEQQRLNQVYFQFTNINRIEIKDEQYPSINDIQKRADVLAKLYLLEVHIEEHRKLKQVWKNDEDYQELLKKEKKFKTQIEPEKMKEGELEDLDILLEEQVNKILDSLEDKANIIAHDLFRQHNGEKAVQTKKSAEKLRNAVLAEPNSKARLKMLVAYKQRKSL